MRVINSSNWRELVRSPRGLTLRDLWQDSCALVVPPAKSMPSDCERPKASHPPNADYDTILFEWTEFLGALRQCGVELISPEIDEWFADQVFVGDHLRLFGHLCVQGQMQSRRRQREAQRIAKAARRLIPCENWRSIAACDPTAVLEIGNIVAFPECRLAFVGISGRVNESGVRVFRQICAELDWRAVPTEFDSSRITHLSTAIAPIGDGVALVDPTATDPVHLNRQGIETIDTPP
ncbi:MAG TPA: hypothetical protein PLP17_10625, partial [Oligoflexia bacterium]|nr:hypothetical protein [Oligoflexia bacterium]